MRLKGLNLLSLEEIRMLIDELNLYKIRNGMHRVTNTVDVELTTARVTRHNIQFYLLFATTNVECHIRLLYTPFILRFFHPHETHNR